MPSYDKLPHSLLTPDVGQGTGGSRKAQRMCPPKPGCFSVSSDLVLCPVSGRTLREEGSERVGRPGEGRSPGRGGRKRGRKKENVGRREGKGSEGEEEKTLRKWRRYQRREKGRERGGRNGGREGVE